MKTLPRHRRPRAAVILGFATALLAGPSSAAPGPSSAPASPPLESAFETPPDTAKPWTYWYWLAGNISNQGISHDVEAMARAGIGAVLMGDINDGPPGPVSSLSPEWWESLRHAVHECRKNGIEFGMFNSPGWSQSGGPWVTREDSMQVPVATEADIDRSLPLRAPPRAQGAFRDLALLAIPLSPADSRDARSAGATLSSSPQFPDLPALLDGDPATRLAIPAATAAAPVEIDLAFEKPFSARSLRLVPAARCNLKGELLAADAAGVFQPVASFEFGRNNTKPQNGFLPLGPGVLGFAPVESTRWRVRLTAPATLAELELSASPAVPYLVEKQFGKLDKMLIDTPPWPALAAPTAASGEPAGAVPARSVIDLTSKLRPDETVDWTPPPGDWRLLRVSLASTGVINFPATKAACGLEVDKMSRAALGRHLEAFVGKFHASLPPEDAAAFKYIVADSWEVGGQTWTHGHREWFQERLGYDPVPWLPVLFGHVVGDVERSERFLFDLRRLAADRMARDYAGGLVDLARPLGLRVWLENYGHWGFPIESLQYGGAADMIGGEFWMNGNPRPNASELQAATSAGFLYGKSRVSAEAFTSGAGMDGAFSHLPRDYKRIGDWAFSTGVNHLVLHLYIHQPDEGRPGVNAWFGEMFNRHNPLFEMMPGPVGYWRRASALLQRGERIVDLAYFIGEDVPVTVAQRIPAPAPGHAAVDINADTIVERLEVRDGRFVLPHGASFRLLVLPPAERIRPATLRRIRDLVRAGGAVLGQPPSASPSLQNYPACDEEVRSLAAEIWSGNDGRTVRETTLGRGRVFRGLETAAALQALGARPAVAWKGKENLVWIARAEGDAKIFFVANQAGSRISPELSFDVSGLRPELFQAVDGSVTPAPAWSEREGRSVVPLTLDPFQSVFVVFRSPGTPTAAPAPAPSFAELAALPESWDVSFAPSLAEPFERSGEKLVSLHEHADPAVRHFAGIATYRARFTPPPAAASSELFLDLADLRGAAEVLLNGRSLGHLWTTPSACVSTPPPFAPARTFSRSAAPSPGTTPSSAPASIRPRPEPRPLASAAPRGSSPMRPSSPPASSAPSACSPAAHKQPRGK